MCTKREQFRFSLVHKKDKLLYYTIRLQWLNTAIFSLATNH